jgi:hypothetical protein
MIYYKFWTRACGEALDPRGKRRTFACLGGSNRDTMDAQAMAERRLQAAISKIECGDFEASHASYYENSPLREQLLEEIALPGQSKGIRVRNRYGAEVLCVSNALFVDIDVGAPPSRGLLGSLFGRKPPEELPPAFARRLEKVRGWHAENPSRSLRVYRTHSGLRLLFTDGLYDPKSGESERIMMELEADPFYRKLCVRQECYRARLTPKPWRCGLASPSGEFPFINEKVERRYRAWLERYQAKSADYVTCRFLETLGSETRAPELTRVIELHDEASGCDRSGELA